MTSSRRMMVWIAAAFGVWIVLSLLPGHWKTASGNAGFGVVGTLALVERGKNGKVKVSLMTNWKDWIGLAIFVLAILAVRSGADLLTVIKLLRG